MRILIVHETCEGQTAKVAAFAKERALTAGYSVQSLEISAELADVSFDDIDKVVLAAPVHERRHPYLFEAFVKNNLDALHARPCLMISVSLKAAFNDTLDEARDYLAEMKMRTGLQPNVEVLAAGAVRAGGYDYFERQILMKVVLEGQDRDQIKGPREFTDWQSLGADLDAFWEAGTDLNDLGVTQVGAG